jgi:hypothetical protein
MKSEIVLRSEAMEILTKYLGLVDAERFIDIIKKDKFDYTEWRKDLWEDKTIEEIHQMGIDYQNELKKHDILDK